MLNHDLLFSVPCCLLLDGLIKETTCNVMVDHLQSRAKPWRQYASHVKDRGTSSKMDVQSILSSKDTYLNLTTSNVQSKDKRENIKYPPVMIPTKVPVRNITDGISISKLTITQKMAYQGRPEFHVVFSMILCRTNLSI